MKLLTYDELMIGDYVYTENYDLCKVISVGFTNNKHNIRVIPQEHYIQLHRNKNIIYKTKKIYGILLDEKFIKERIIDCDKYYENGYAIGDVAFEYTTYCDVPCCVIYVDGKVVYRCRYLHELQHYCRLFHTPIRIL